MAIDVRVLGNPLAATQTNQGAGKPPSRVAVENPFSKATPNDKRLKLFVWGDSGIGKTTLSLSFPSPVVIDLEGGTDLYGGAYDFYRIRTNSPDVIAEAIEWLGSNVHDYKTLVIDPITLYSEALSLKWSNIFLERNKLSKGFKHEYYELQPKDYMPMKAELKDLLRKLMVLDMNVVITARGKTRYKENSMMVADGETFDGDKTLAYMFDVIIHMYKENGQHLGLCTKDRSNRFPKTPFLCNYDTVKAYCDADSLTRAASVVLSTVEQQEEIVELIQAVGMSSEAFYTRLAAYGVSNTADLTAIDAASIITKLQAAVQAKLSATAVKGATTNAPEN